MGHKWKTGLHSFWRPKRQKVVLVENGILCVYTILQLVDGLCSLVGKIVENHDNCIILFLNIYSPSIINQTNCSLNILISLYELMTSSVK